MIYFIPVFGGRGVFKHSCVRLQKQRFLTVCLLASSFDASNQKYVYNYAFKTFSFINVACGCKYICFNVPCYISYKLIHTDACENQKHFMHYIRIQISTSFVHTSHSTPQDCVCVSIIVRLKICTWYINMPNPESY